MSRSRSQISRIVTPRPKAMLTASPTSSSRAVGGHDPAGGLLDPGEVARLLAVAEDHGRIPAGSACQLGDHLRARPLSMRARPVRVERPDHRDRQAVRAHAGLRVELARGLRRTVDGRRAERVVLLHRNRAPRSRTPPTRRRRRSVPRPRGRRPMRDERPRRVTSWLRFGLAREARRLSQAMCRTTETPSSSRSSRSRSRTSPTTSLAPPFGLSSGSTGHRRSDRR